jgi:ferredoxin--NADP+ reductase
LLILEDEFKAVSDELIVVTDDGSYGRKALVTEPLAEICGRDPKPNLAVAIGPTIMMKFCCATTKKFDVPTQVSLNTIMVDGTGMCGGCRVEVGGKTKFVCVDGPEFDGHQVNFEQMIKRMGAYRNLEQKAYEKFKDHKCRIGLDQKPNS